MTWVCDLCETSFPEKPSGGPTSEVLAAVNVARAERGDPPLTRGPGFFDPVPSADRRVCQNCGTVLSSAP